MHEYVCGQHALFGMSARWRLAVRRPIGQFCAHEGWLHSVPVAAPNGGYARAGTDPTFIKLMRS
jgi:hypothetical protein